MEDCGKENMNLTDPCRLYEAQFFLFLLFKVYHIILFFKVYHIYYIFFKVYHITLLVSFMEHFYFALILLKHLPLNFTNYNMVLSHLTEINSR